MCYPPDEPERHHHSNVWFGVLAVAGAVALAIALTAPWRPSVNAQYYTGCFAGNVCPAGR